MNRIYRTLWSVATQTWQAVPETAKSAGKKSKSTSTGIVASFALSWVLSGAVNAQSPPAITQLPTGGNVTRGTATISQTATAQAAAMTVNQTSQRAVVNWSTFNLGSAASLNFVQPNAQAVTLNRVNDSNPSQIFGRITANGQVFLSNANGVYFSPTSSVDVGALTATTHSINDDNFMSGKYLFERHDATGKVVNEGHINAALGGFVALLAPEVQNAGVVVARMGTVTMAAGERISLNMNGTGSLAGITTTPSTIATLIENKLAVLAPDGQIILSAVALNKLQAGVVKNSGNLEANSLVNKGGKIVLEGDDITLERNSKIEAKGATGGGTVLVGGDWQGSGDLRQAIKVIMEAGATVDASATNNGDGGKVVLWSDVHNANSVTRVNGSIKAGAGPNGGEGGKVETSGHYLDVDGIQVSTQSTKGNAGEWLLDPYDITIASSGDTGTTWAGGTTGTNPKIYTSATTSTILDTSITTALASNNVTIKTGGTVGDGNGTGNITVSADLTIPNNKTLTFDAFGGTTGTGNITIGSSGYLKFTQAGNSTYSGNLSGAGYVHKIGAGTLSLTGNNSYTGGTTISSGTLNMGSATALGATGAINFSGGTLQYSAASSGFDFTNDGGVNRTNSFAADYSIDTNGQNITLTGRVGGFNATNSPGSFTKLGAGTVTLSNSNGYYGTTTVNGGTLAVSNGWGLGSSTRAVVASGATLEYRTVVNSMNTIVLNGGTFKAGTGSSSYSGAITLGAPGSAIETSVSMMISGVISGVNYDLTKLGTDKLYLTGANTYSGATIVNAGTLVIGLGTNTGSIANTTGVSIGSGAKFQTYRSDAVTLSYPISGDGGFINSSTGTLTLTGNNTYTGGTTLTAGTLNLGSANAIGSSGPITFTGGILQYPTSSSVNASDYSARIDSSTANQLYKIDTNGQSISYASAFGSTGSTLSKLGAGTLTLGGANTYTGQTTVTTGTLAVTNTAGLGTTAAGTTVNTGATLDLQGAIGAEAITMSGGTLKASTGSSSLDGNIAFSSATTVDIGGTELTLKGTASGSGVVTKQGSGALILTGTNSLSSVTVSSGTLRVGNGGTSGTLGTSAVATVNSSLVVDRSDAYSLSSILSSVSGNGNVSLSSGGNLTIDKAISLTGTNSLIDIFSTGNLTLGGVTLSDTGASGTIKFRANGGVTFSSPSGVLSASGANGSITLSAGNDLLAGDTTAGYDINLTSAGSNAISTSATGTINFFQGNANTTALSSKIVTTAAGGIATTGASVTKKYKNYGATYASLSSSVAGTRNFYYRLNPSAISVTNVTARKTYDGTVTAMGYITGGTIVGLSGEEAGLTGTSLAFTTAEFDTPNQGLGKNLTLGGVSINTATWGIRGVSATIGAGSSGIIDKANLTLSGTKVYDGTTVVAGSQLLATGVHSESFTVTGTGATGNLSSADVQPTSTVLASVAGLAVGVSNGVNTGDASNYNPLITTNSTFSVSRATATLTAQKVYDANNTLTGSQLAITGVTVGGTTQTLNYTGSATLFDPNVATPNNYVTNSNLVLANNGSYLANNYVLPDFSRNANNTATVSAATATVTANKDYNSNTSLSAGQVTITGVNVNGSPQTLGFTGTATVSDANVFTSNKYVNTGSMTLTDGATGLASNYVLPTSAYNATSNKATINRFTLTATDINPASSVYGDTLTPGTVTFANKFGTDDVNAVVTVTVPAGALSGGGVAKIGDYYQSANTSLTGTKAGNYLFAGLTSSTPNYSITQRALVGSGITSAQSIYGQALTNGVTQFSNAVAGDDVSAPVTVNTSTTSSSGHFVANTYTQTAGATLSGADAANYTFVGYTTPTANYTIQKLALTGTTVAASSSIYASALTPGTVSWGNVIGADSVSSTATVVTSTTSSSNKPIAGTYAQTVASNSLTGSDAGNYSLSSAYTTPTNNYTIQKLALTAAGDIGSASSTYGSSLSPGVLAFSNVVGADSVNAPISVNISTLSSSGKPIVGNYTQTAGTALTGIDAGNYTYVGRTSSTPNYTINALALTGTSIASGTSAYSSSLTPGAVTFSNVVTGDAVNTTATVNTTAFSQSGNATVGSYTQTTSTTLSGADAANYSLAAPYTSASNYTITPKALVVSVPGASKVYDHSNTIYLTSPASILGAISSDDVQISAGNVTGFVDKNVGTNKAVTYTGFALTGNDAGNYSLPANPASTADITPKAITASGITATNKVYDATNSANLNLTAATLTGGASSTTDNKYYSGDTVTLTTTSATGTFADANAGNAKSVSISGLTLGGADANNYTVTDASNATANITAKTLTVTGLGAPVSRVYNATLSADVTGTPALLSAQTAGTGNSTDGKPYVGDVIGFTGSATGSYNSKDVATASTVTFAGLLSNNSNYTLDLGSQNASITRADLSLSGLSALSKTYDASRTATLSGTPSVSALSGDTVTVNASSAAALFADKNVGTSKSITVSGYSLSGTDANNYNLIQPSGLTADISKADLSITGISALNKVYDASTTATLSGTASVAAFAGDSASLSGTGSGAFADKNVGTGKSVTVTGYTLSGVDANNYTLRQPTNLSADITAASLTISGITASDKTYDGNTSATLSVANVVKSGLYAGDEVNVAATGLFNDKNVGTGKAVTLSSTYTGADTGNYLITSQSSTLADITAKALGLSIPGASRQYDGSTSISPSGPISLLGVVGADQVTLGNGTVTGYVDKNVGTNKTVTYNGLVLSGADMGNYTLPAQPTSDANITPAPLTISGITAANKTYDATTSATINATQVIKTGLIGNDVVEVSTSGSFADKNAGIGKTVNLSSTYSGVDVGNYTITDQATTTADIGKASLTVTADNAHKLFGNANPALTATLSGFVGGETLATSGVSGSAAVSTTATLNTAPGTAVITATAGTLAANNYDFARFVDAELTIQAISSLGNDQVVALIGAQLSNLSRTQIGSFSTTQLQVFSAQQVSSLSMAQVGGLTAAQMSSLNNAQLQALTSGQVAALTPDQLSALTPVQIGFLTKTSVLSERQVLSLSPEQIAGIAPASFVNMTANELGAFSNAQLQALTTAQIASIAPRNFALLTPEQIMALSITQVQNLTPEQLMTFSPAQVASLSAAEIAYFDARQLAAIGIYPTVEAPASEPAPTVAIAPPPPPPSTVATVLPEASAPSVAAAKDSKEDTNKAFEAAIPVMTDVATASALPTPVPNAATMATSLASAPVEPKPGSSLSPRALQGLLLGPNAETSASTGVLPITILNHAQTNPVTAGVAYEQGADTVTLRSAAAPAIPPLTAKLVFSDKLTTFMVADTHGDTISFEGSVVNNRMIIVAPSLAAKRLARSDMHLVLAAAVTSLGRTNRIMLAELKGVLLDLR